MNALRCFMRALRSAFAHRDDHVQEERLTTAMANVVQANEHRSRAAQALEEAARLARGSRK